MRKLKRIIRMLFEKVLSRPDIVRDKVGRMAVRDKFEDIKMLLKGVENPIVVDGGANSGGTISNFLRTFADPTIFAFEPIPHLVHGLKESFGQIPKVKVFEQALGDIRKEVDFNITNYNPSASMFTPSLMNKAIHRDKMDIVEVIRVVQVRLDEVLPEEQISVIKLDLQGYELKALEGCVGRLGTVAVILTEIEFVELYDGQPLFSDIADFLNGYGFELFNLYELYTQEDGQLTSGDAIFVNRRLERG